MLFHLGLRAKMLPKINNGKYTEKKANNKDRLHSEFSPFLTVFIELGFVIRIGPNLNDQSEHTAVNGALDDSFELAVNVDPRFVTL